MTTIDPLAAAERLFDVPTAVGAVAWTGELDGPRVAAAQFATVTGWAPADVGPGWWDRAIPGEDLTLLRAALQGAAAGERATVQHRVIAPNGSVCWVRHLVALGPDGAGVCGLLMALDPERAEAEMRLREEARAADELRALAATLQASLLPPHAPHIAGMEVGARFRPADGPLTVGGDFYDVFRLRTNDWGLALGDVCGKGASAATLTAMARYTIRAAAVHDLRPSEVLAELNAAILDDDPVDDRFLTAVFARLELDVCGAWVTLSVGGHLQPVVVRRSGWVDVRGRPGTIVGAFEELDVSDDRVGLGPGDAIVFVTDGVTEARNENGEQLGEEGLWRELVGAAGMHASAIAAHVESSALAFSHGRAADDMAIVVLRVPEDAKVDPEARMREAAATLDLARRSSRRLEGTTWSSTPSERPMSAIAPTPQQARTLLAADVDSTRRARHFMKGCLHSWRYADDAVQTAQLLVSELVGNAARHVGGDVEVVVRHFEGLVRIEVFDGSTVLPRRRDIERDATSGRGLHIIEEISTGWGAQVTPGGKVVWCDLRTGPPDGDDASSCDA